jgi:integrase
LFKYQFRNKKREMGLGSTKVFTLPEARELRRRARQALFEFNDPLEARRAQRAQQTAEAARSKIFSQVASEFFEAKADAWSARHRADFQQKVRAYLSPTLANVPITAIDETLVQSVLTPIWKTKIVTAGRVMRHLAAIIDYASACGYRPKGNNPARWRGHLQHVLADPTKLARPVHLASMPYAALPAFMTELRAQPGVPARALEFAILCAVRTGEIRGATWDEIDLDAATWTIPASRMKCRRQHKVPLSRQAVALLHGLPREGQFVFIGSKAGRPVGKDALLTTLKGLRSELSVSVHGFRSTIRDWIAERTSFSHEVAETVLAHVTSSQVGRAYFRSDLYEQRARLMQSWADFTESTPVEGEVTPLRARS